MKYRSVVENTSLRELQKLPQSEQDSRMWIRLAENVSKVQSHLYSRRIANQKDQSLQWKQVLLIRHNVEEIWVCFTPDEIESARKYHSYPYFRHCLERGETVLASLTTCAWNTLGKDEKILGVMYSAGKLTTWDFKKRVENARKNFNF
jgi:hypothetical protein